jgi:hypothetical protein
MATTTQISLDSFIPTGEWTLYFHSPREKKWGIETYTAIGIAKTWRDVYGILNALGENKIRGGMYFWMRRGIPPLWENFQNIRGGSYSLRGSLDSGVDVFITYSVAAMLGVATHTKDDKIVGCSISPKLVGNGDHQNIGFYVIKVWNQDCTTYNKPNGLQILDRRITLEEILYVPHNEKKM